MAQSLVDERDRTMRDGERTTENERGEAGVENDTRNGKIGPEDLLSGHGEAAKMETGKSEKKPSEFKELWQKIGLDLGTVLMMFK